jgi:CHASE2 domain-containing sensor protein
MSNVNGAAGQFFPINYRINLDTIPQLSVADVVSGGVGGKVRGKTVIIGATSDNIDDSFSIPGRGLTAGVFFHVLGAETLKRGVPVTLGWMPMLVLALVFVVIAAHVRARRQVLTMAAALILTLVVPIMTEAYQWFVDITPALFLLACVASAQLRCAIFLTSVIAR